MDQLRRGVERAQDNAPPHLLAGRGLGRGGQVPAQHRTEDAGVAVHLPCLAKSPVQPGQLVGSLVPLVPQYPEQVQHVAKGRQGAVQRNTFEETDNLAAEGESAAAGKLDGLAIARPAQLAQGRQ